jgi:hypothetical protein
MALQAGSRLGPYEVVGLLGSGGMARSTAPATPAWVEALRIGAAMQRARAVPSGA